MRRVRVSRRVAIRAFGAAMVGGRLQRFQRLFSVRAAKPPGARATRYLIRILAAAGRGGKQRLAIPQ
ncbi:hypothetical protein GCM10008997_20460 [Halomonas salifodinae]